MVARNCKKYLWWLIVGLVMFFALVVFAKPHYDARLSWYKRGDSLDGASVLVTCFSRTPKFLYGGLFPWDGKIDEPLLADLEVWFACRTVDDNAQTIASDVDIRFGENRTFDGLVHTITNCKHPGFSPEESQLCVQSHFDAIDWMIAQGAPINPEDSCGYLHAALLEMKEELFYFLLSRGADPDQLCPQPSRASEVNSEPSMATVPHTVEEMLQALLAEYTVEEQNTIVVGWTRMLEELNKEPE